MSIALLGSGYWGKNLLRNFHSLGALGMVCDASSEARERARGIVQEVPIHDNVDPALRDPKISAVVIATPAVTHFDLAKKALAAGKDVFVEKPLALRLTEGNELVKLAHDRQRVLMVGHILQYHPGLLKLKEMVDAGELGKIEYIYSNRLNFGKIRKEENILWSFAPHDISIMLWLIGAAPVQATAVGGSYLQPNVVDTTISTFLFPNGVRAHIYVSWLHPFKEQRLVVVGSKQMVAFNDQAPKGQKLLLHKKNISIVEGAMVAGKMEGVAVPYEYDREPLRAECEHFLKCIETRAKPRTDGEEGLRVLHVLDACQRSLEMSGQPVQLGEFHA
ncbi:MAG: Gfo/Idh/MocA family oxidoreductase [Pseudomonadota bacterium]